MGIAGKTRRSRIAHWDQVNLPEALAVGRRFRRRLRYGSLDRIAQAEGRCHRRPRPHSRLFIGEGAMAELMMLTVFVIKVMRMGIE